MANQSTAAPRSLDQIIAAARSKAAPDDTDTGSSSSDNAGNRFPPERDNPAELRKIPDPER